MKFYRMVRKHGLEKQLKYGDYDGKVKELEK